jgi:hypothetical protein
MPTSMQEIFREHFGSFAASRTLHPRELRAAWCITHCYSPALGGHLLECPDGHHSIIQYHACRHRSCPRCADAPRQRWLDAALALLLPCPHFHVVFTLAHALIPLWEFNRAWFNQLLFDCVRQSLLQLCADPRRLGVLPGLLMALHSWGRTLNHHPHVHCLVTAGGVTPEGSWRASRTDFLLPVRPLQCLLRGKLLAHVGAALRSGRLRLPPHLDLQYWRRTVSQLYREHLNVEISPAYPHGRGVAVYLARYLKGGPLPKGRPLQLHHNVVSFGYTDHRDHQRKTLRLSAHEFISRILWHAPPEHQHTVRRAGLYASAHRLDRQRCRSMLEPLAPPLPAQALAWHAPLPDQATLCPTCAKPLLTTLTIAPTHRLGEFSIEPHAQTQRVGPTGRSNGHSTAGRSPPPSYSRLRAAAC